MATLPIDYLRHLAGQDRSPRANRHLGRLLAFVAGAANAGGFLAVGQYTSHMTGMVSAAADHLVLGEFALMLAGLVSVLSFTLGAMTTALLVNWARARGLASRYALPLVLEALLLMLFGVFGWHIQHRMALVVPLAVLLLCFMMGLQNAIITKVSDAVIRTTHVTGMITDLGIELGRLLYWQGRGPAAEARAQSRRRLRLHGSLVLMFFGGGIVGALGFQALGFQAVLPLALLLLGLSLPPVLDDLRRG